MTETQTETQNSNKNSNQMYKQHDLLRKGSWTDADKLEYMELNIAPYSRYWRMGMKKALKHAIRLLREEEAKADRLAYERGVKHAWEVAQKVFDSTVTFYEAEDVAKQIDKMSVARTSLRQKGTSDANR